MDPIDIDFIRKDQSTDKRVLEVYEHLKEYKDATERSKWIERRKTNWKAIENDMTDEKVKKQLSEKGQEDVIVNKIQEGVEGSAAIVTDQKPELKFLPIGSGDLYVAELLKRAWDTIWEQNEGSDTTYELKEEQSIGGLGFFGVQRNMSKDPFGFVEILEEPPDDIYFDKNSRKRDFSDTPLIKAKLRSIEYIKAMYPDIKVDREIYFMPISHTDESKSEGHTGEDEYTFEGGPVPDEAKKKQKNIWEIQAWMLDQSTEDWSFEITEGGDLDAKPIQLSESQGIKDIVDFENKDPETGTYRLKGNKNAYYWKRPVLNRVLRIIVGKKLISEEINPHGRDREGDPLIDIIAYKSQRTISAYPMSKTDYALPLNRSLNKRHRQAEYLVSQSYGGELVLPEQHRWENKGQPDATLIVGKGAAFQPMRLQPSSIDATIILTMVEGLISQINDVYHLQDVVRGKIPPGHGQLAGRTVLALQDFAGTMSKPDIRKLESALVRLAKIAIAFALKYWPRAYWERLLEDEERLNFAPNESKESRELDRIEEDEDEEAEQIRQKIAAKWEKALELIRPKDINKPAGISLLDIDVKIVAGSSMPTNRIAKMEMAIELAQAEIYDREAALEYIDDPNKDKIVARMKAAEAKMMQQAALGLGKK